MQGRIYISSAFTNLKYSICKPNQEWLDNDPHFWNPSKPPTWGICRTDFRKQLKKEDYIFFVLPKYTQLSQMIYGYMKILENITHVEAYKKYPEKRMKNGNPNGNIIVDENGNYNRFDLGIHEDKFEEIKKYYVIGVKANSRLLSEKDIKRLAPSFLSILNKIFDSNSEKIFSIIGRKGRVLNEQQIVDLLNWLNH